MWDLEIGELFRRGGGVMWPLLGCSVVALGVAVERLIVFAWRFAPYQPFVDRLQQLSAGGESQSAAAFLAGKRHPLAHLAKVYLDHRHRPRPLRHEIVAREASRQLNGLERRTHWLAMIGHLAPMIGLLGTVVGLVEAFRQIESAGGTVQPNDLAAGIWTALLTTVFGLTVALPTLAVYHLLDQRVAALGVQMQWLTSHLDEWFDDVPAESLESRPASQGGVRP